MYPVKIDLDNFQEASLGCTSHGVWKIMFKINGAWKGIAEYAREDEAREMWEKVLKIIHGAVDEKNKDSCDTTYEIGRGRSTGKTLDRIDIDDNWKESE